MTVPLRAGAAIVDITPPSGLAMAGFGVRTEPALGAHDRLTARAIAVDDTTIVAVDVLGLHSSTTERIRRGCALPSDRVVVAALHTHGGPQTLLGHHQKGIDPDYMTRLENGCIAAIDAAVAAQRPARWRFGIGEDPGVARNRRQPGGVTDPSLPVLSIEATDGAPIATLIAYACHPVVLGADNRLWTADYPGFVRGHVEAARPGDVAVFLTGCTGDANTGHHAHASNTLAASSARTFEMAERFGKMIGTCAMTAPLGANAGGVDMVSTTVELGFARRERLTNAELAAAWRLEREAADPARQILLGTWIEWAERGLPSALEQTRIPVRVSALRWGEVEIVALPGEIFAETAHTIRQLIGNPNAVVVGFADDNPGYIPPTSEFPHGGYEIDEAHRYYGMPATFAPGSAEALADAAAALVTQLRGRDPSL